MRGNTPLELTWTITPMLIFVVFFILGAIVYFDAYRPPDDATEIYGVGKQWIGSSSTRRDSAKSTSCTCPRPALQGHADFQAVTTASSSPPSAFITTCCPVVTPAFGSSRPRWANFTFLLSILRKLTPAWSARRRHGAGAYSARCCSHAEGSMALEGRKVFLKYRCISCHSANENARARFWKTCI